MTNPPPLFDLNLKSQRRARALKIGFVDFLHAEAASILRERLEEINKIFTRPVVVSGTRNVWQDAMADAHIIPDDETLALKGPYDLAIHAMCAHAANDPVGQFIQLRHALEPDGLMLVAMFGGQTLHELRSCLAEAEVQIRGGLSPRVSPMAEIRDLGGLIGRAGLALPVADNITLTTSYESPLHLMRDLRGMGETNILSSQDRRLLRRDVLARACEIYLEAFPAEGGRITATFELVFLTGWAPHDTQQQPLRPGSAKKRLADALGATEQSAGEKTGQN